MARKSRKNLSEKIKTERNMELFASSEQRRIPTAIYVRLSFENNGTFWNIRTNMNLWIPMLITDIPEQILTDPGLQD